MHKKFLGLYFCNSILHVVGWKITLTVTTPLSTAVNIPVCLIILYVSELRCIRPPVKKKRERVHEPNIRVLCQLLVRTYIVNQF